MPTVTTTFAGIYKVSNSFLKKKNECAESRYTWHAWYDFKVDEVIVNNSYFV